MTPLDRFAHVARLRDEIVLLKDCMEANESTSEIAAAEAFDLAIRAGISEWDAEHPCRAIEQREQLIESEAPDVALRAMSAPQLPGLF